MPDKAGPNQRLKILYLYRILSELTDSEHGLTANELMTELERCGIKTARKALYEDIEALRVFGLDISGGRGKNADYRLCSRDFELPELKLLADAVSSAQFLTKRKSDKLLKKIAAMTSVYEGRQIQRQVYVADRVKTYNEKIYYNVDMIHRAIAQKRQISFKYFDYDIAMNKVYRDGIRVCSPYALTWDSGRYYLVAYYPKRGKVANFRVDRMEYVKELDEKCFQMPDSFDLNEYLNSGFSMFSGVTESVKLRFKNDLINAVTDRFGRDIIKVPDGDGHFTVRVNVQPKPPFFAWVFQFAGAAEIVAPESVRKNYHEMLENALKGNDI